MTDKSISVVDNDPREQMVHPLPPGQNSFGLSVRWKLVCGCLITPIRHILR